jgi:hypothetical protein
VTSALEESAAAVVLISSSLAKDRIVNDEIRVMLDCLRERGDDDRSVVPVRLEADAKVPEQLTHINWLNLFEDGGMERLIAGLKRVTGRTA